MSLSNLRRPSYPTRMDLVKTQQGAASAAFAGANSGGSGSGGSGGGGGSGDMLQSIYDPNGIGADAFDYNFFENVPVLATVATSGLYSDLSGTPSLATVATTGSYSDLTGKPLLVDSFLFAPYFSPMANSTYGANAFVAVPIFPIRAVTLTGVKAYVNTPGASDTVYSGLYQGASLTGATLVRQGTAASLVSGLNTMPFTSSVSLTAETMYWLGMTILGSNSTNMATSLSRPIAFFSQSTGTLPSTAGTASPTTGTNATLWGY